MSTNTPHIPAWKRLGLKLKHANESPSNITAEPGNDVSGRKRKQVAMENGINGSEPSTKKSKTNGLAKQQPMPEESTKFDSSSDIRQQNTLSTPQPKQTKRKKSVSFTVDTKDEDGDTAQTVQLSNPNSPGSTPKKPKKEKKPKSERNSITSSPIPRKSKDSLDYLNQHYHDRPTWKFNKNREIWILKHFLSTDEIPIEFSAPLSGYVHGLKSAGARDRLIKECWETLNKPSKDDQKPKYKSRFSQDLESDTLQQSQGRDEAYSTWIKNQPRPRLVLMSLGRDPDGVRPRIANGVVQPVVKKSKARTSRIEVESDSSSDSDSDSSSEDESDDGTSSSGSSSADSSSSESDDSENETSPSKSGESGSGARSGVEDETSSEDSDSDSDSERD